MKKTDPEIEQFQTDLLESVLQMKGGQAARVTQVKTTVAAEAPYKSGKSQTEFSKLLGVTLQ